MNGQTLEVRTSDRVIQRDGPKAESLEGRIISLSDFTAASSDIRLETLRTFTASVKVTASTSLAPLLPILVTALHDQNSGVKHQAAVTLHAVVAHADFEDLRAAWLDRDGELFERLCDSLRRWEDSKLPSFRAHAYRILPRLRSTTDTELEERLLDRAATEYEVYARRNLLAAFELFAGVGSTRSKLALRTALSDRHPAIQSFAIRAAARNGDIEVLPILIDKLSDSSTIIRFDAAEAIRRFAYALQPHLSAINAKLMSESDPTVRASLERLVADIQQGR